MNTTKHYLSTMAQQLIPYTMTFGTKGELNFSSNTLPTPPPSLIRLRKDMSEDFFINEYPDPSYRKLRSLIADYEGVTPEMIAVTDAGDEAIDVVGKATLNEGDTFITAPPTFEIFSLQSIINGGNPVDVPFIGDDFQVDVETMIQKAQEKNARLIFLCNPNNPTGSTISNEKIETILKNVSCIVVVDEVYREFYGVSALPLLQAYDNLVILRSFSKFAALAGARVAYLIANQQLTDVFNGIRFPMGVSLFSDTLARYVLTYDRDWIKQQVAMIQEERKKMKMRLSKFGFTVYPSQANFFLVRIGEKAKQIVAQLQQRGILIRDRSNKPYLSGCVRITVRSQKENESLYTALKEIIYEK